jgi:cytochrome b involved in lipid metabolism
MKNTAIIISIIFIIVVGFLMFKPHTAVPEPVVNTNTAVVKEPSTQPAPTTPIPKPQTTPTPTTPVDTTKYYASAEVGLHAGVQSCWSIVNGKIYDLTPWINQHPGGSNAIKRMCGVDGSKGFNDQHGGQSRPERELAAFYIGVLK